MDDLKKSARMLPTTTGSTYFDGQWVQIVPRIPPGIVALASAPFAAPEAGSVYYPLLEISEDGTKVRLRLERLGTVTPGKPARRP